MSSSTNVPASTTADETTTLRLPVPGGKVHFVGIGGIGMSGLARMLNAWGYAVSGSDSGASEVTAALLGEGIPVTIGHSDSVRAVAADLVVMTAAVRGANAEIDAASAAGVPIVKRAGLLGLLTDARRGVAVAGSHGKSTTSGMLVAALRALGADPNYAIGAVLGATGTNAAPGSGEVMVVEADEYDYSFLTLHPDIAIVTNLDYDHPDLFPDQATYDQAFVQFVRQVRTGGTLILSADDAGSVRLCETIGELAGVEIVTFGVRDDADWRLDGGPGSWVAVERNGVRHALSLQVPGEHNARNALSAVAALVALGHDAGASSAALAAFSGIGRRFETKGESGGVLVIDDYAHHPRELAATLSAARERFPERRIWAVFQPHTYSRTHAMLDEFAQALTLADKTTLLDVYAAREQDTLGVSSRDLANRLGGAVVVAGPEAAAVELAATVQPGDVVLTLGAGDVTATGPKLLSLLRGANGADEPARATEQPSRRRSASSAKGVAETVPGTSVRIQRDAPMSLYTTWRIGGPAQALIRAADADELAAAAAWGREQGLPVTVIGGGSNLLVPDAGIDGLVVLVRTPGERAERLVQVEDLGDAVRVRIGAPAPLSWAGRYAAEHGWSGLDWGVGLPGTIGGATVNNAGAHGTELKDHLERIVVIGADGELREEPAAWLDASYRRTRIKAQPRPRTDIVVESVFVLPKGDREVLIALAEDHARFRKETQPTGACAGSVFANPPGDYAGRLLEGAGLKGHRIGGAMFSPKHANWIINDGSATAVDVQALVRHAQTVIQQRYDVALHMEIESLG